MEITKHFTVVTYIVYENSILLHFHKKRKTWLPVGGHIERDELPQETAIRKVKKESGLDIQIYQSKNPFPPTKETISLMLPQHLLLENINEYHQHIVFIYYATTKQNTIYPQEGESKTLQWFTKEDLQKTELLDTVYKYACEALEIRGQKKVSSMIY